MAKRRLDWPVVTDPDSHDHFQPPTTCLLDRESALRARLGFVRQCQPQYAVLVLGLGLRLVHFGRQLEEDEKSWTVRIDVPGVPRDQLLVQISGNVAEIRSDNECPRKISAAYELPADIDADKTKAHLQDRVLTLNLAKAESAVTRRIEVH